MTSALLVKADGEVRHIDLPTTDAHIMIHHMVGGWFDVVRHPTKQDTHAFVHDEGLLLKQQVNVAMSYLFGQLLVGDIVLSRSTHDGSEADFAVSTETMELYKSCNTNNELRTKLQDRVENSDQSWKIEIQEL